MERNTCFCGRERREDNIICPRCYEMYKKELPGLIRKGEVLELGEWLEKKVGEELTKSQPLLADLENKKDKFKTLQDKVQEEAFQRMKERVGNKKIPTESFNVALGELRKQLWGERGGHSLFAEMKSLEKEVEEKTSALYEALKMVKERKKAEATTKEAEKIIENVQKDKK